LDLRASAGSPGSAKYSPEPPPTSLAGLLPLAALAIICCGLPLLIGALVAIGGGDWLIAHRSLLALPVVGLAAGLFWWSWRHSSG